MATFLDRLENFDVEWEVNNCLRPRLPSPSQKSDERSASSNSKESRKRKLGSSNNEPIDVDIGDLMDHSIEVDFSSEVSSSESISSSESPVKNSVEGPPKKKRRLSGDLPEEKPKPDLGSEPQEAPKQMLTTTVTTPTAIITISSPSESHCAPVIIQNDQKPPEQIEAKEPLRDQIKTEEGIEEADEYNSEHEGDEKSEHEAINKPKSSTGSLKAAGKVAAWIAWSGLFFALGRMSDPSAMASLFP